MKSEDFTYKQARVANILLSQKVRYYSKRIISSFLMITFLSFIVLDKVTLSILSAPKPEDLSVRAREQVDR